MNTIISGCAVRAVIQQEDPRRLNNAKRPYSKQIIISELESEIQTYQRSFEEKDGVVRDKKALKTMAIFEDAIRIIEQSIPRKK